MIFVFSAFENKRFIEKNLIKLAVKTDIGPWIYLGHRYSMLLEWEATLKNFATRYSYSKILQEVATNFREKYLYWLADLGCRYNSIEWWASRIAETNTMDESLYHQICYYFVCLDYIKQYEGKNLVIVCESDELIYSLSRKSIYSHLISRLCATNIKLKYIKNIYFKQALNGIRIYKAVKTQYTKIKIISKAQLKKTNKPVFPNKKIVLLHTYINEQYFLDAQGREIYYPGLAKELEARGYHIITLPVLYSITDLPKAIKWLRASQNSYLIPQDYYKFSDLVWLCKKLFMQSLLPFGKHFFLKHDITQIVKRYKNLNPEYLLYYRLFYRLKKNKFNFDTYIDLFENMSTEKTQILAIKKFFPEVKINGYFHIITPYPFFLPLYNSEKINPTLPLPDKIICSSNYVLKQLIAMGHAKERLVIGPSLRHKYFSSSNVDHVRKKNVVLVILSLLDGFCQEILQKIRENFFKRDGITFWIKPHPMMAVGTKLKLFDKYLDLDYMIPSENALEEYLFEVSCVLTSGSTAGLEAALTGVPVVRLIPEINFSFDPLDYFNFYDWSRCDGSRMKDTINKALHLGDGEIEKLKKWAKLQRQEMFPAYAKEKINEFISV